MRNGPPQLLICPLTNEIEGRDTTVIFITKKNQVDEVVVKTKKKKRKRG